MTKPVARRVHWVHLHPLRIPLYPLALCFAPYVLKVYRTSQSLLSCLVDFIANAKIHCYFIAKICTLCDLGLATGLQMTQTSFICSCY